MMVAARLKEGGGGLYSAGGSRSALDAGGEMELNRV
jgi:hypothetical protein